MSEAGARHEVVYEHHIDRALVADVLVGGPVSTLLWNSVGVDPPVEATAFRGAVRSDGRETDVTIVGADRAGRQHTLLVETKIRGRFLPGQAESYRGEVGRQWQAGRDVRSIIVAPKAWLEARSEVSCFDAAVSLEQLATAWGEEAARQGEAADLARVAIDVRGDRRTQAFAQRFREVLAESGCCRLHLNAMRFSTWADFAEPKGLCWKTDYGHLDLTAAEGWDLVALEEHLAAAPRPHPYTAAPAGKSVVVRIEVDKVDVYSGFDEKVGAEVARLARELLTWVTDDDLGRQVVQPRASADGAETPARPG